METDGKYRIGEVRDGKSEGKRYKGKERIGHEERRGEKT